MAKTPVPATSDPKPPTAATAREIPISVIERRIASGQRNLLRPREVPLTGQPEPMTTRTVNTQIESRWYQVTTELGWVPVMPTEIAGGLQGDMRVVDGRVVLGEGGREVLVKMPTRLYESIQRSRAQREDQAMRSKSRFRSRVQQSMEREAATTDRADAESLERASAALGGLEVEQFEVGRERVPLGPPVE